MINPDGSFSCDMCGEDCGNGSVFYCTIVSQLDPDKPGHVRNMHLCQNRLNEDGKIEHKGCAEKALSPAKLKHRTSKLQKEE